MFIEFEVNANTFNNSTKHDVDVDDDDDHADMQ
jgi:hypothetical protein